MRLLTLFLFLVWSSAAIAADVYVVNVQPRYITIQQQQCHQELVQQNNSAIGTVIGGVAGGIIGNQVGDGSGRTAATVAGTIVGGMVGNRIGQDQKSYQYQTVCNIIPVTVQQGEIVTFSYKGRQFIQSFN